MDALVASFVSQQPILSFGSPEEQNSPVLMPSQISCRCAITSFVLLGLAAGTFLNPPPAHATKQKDDASTPSTSITVVPGGKILLVPILGTRCLVQWQDLQSSATKQEQGLKGVATRHMLRCHMALQQDEPLDDHPLDKHSIPQQQ